MIDIGLDRKKIVPILYRPFDIRYTYYTGKSRGFHCMPRPEVMGHMLKDNIGLLTCRQQNMVGFYHAFICDSILESCVVSNKTREINYVFPLYLYPSKNNLEKQSPIRNLMLFELKTDCWTRKTNLSATIIEQLTKNFKKAPSPEQAFFYIYAILYSNIYRTKYSEFLKIDFPRIPFTRDYKLFVKMSDYGKRLADLHLLKSPELDPPIVKFQGNSDNRIEKLRYEHAKLFINKEQYFEGIEPEVFGYQIGGYQVCEKWLKDRKERKLSLDDIKHYCNIATAIQKTIEIQKVIDNIYPGMEM